MFYLDARRFKGRRPLGRATVAQMHRLRSEAPGGLIALGLASVDLDGERLWLLTNGQADGSHPTLSMTASKRGRFASQVGAKGGRRAPPFRHAGAGA
jgi:hypothetical protein